MLLWAALKFKYKRTWILLLKCILWWQLSYTVLFNMVSHKPWHHVLEDENIHCLWEFPMICSEIITKLGAIGTQYQIVLVMIANFNLLWQSTFVGVFCIFFNQHFYLNYSAFCVKFHCISVINQYRGNPKWDFCTSVIQSLLAIIRSQIARRMHLSTSRRYLWKLLTQYDK